jgi:hypothetical protein
MTTETNHQTFCKNWLEAWTGNRPQELLKFYHADAFYSDPSKRNGLKGHEQLLPYFQKLLALNPDWKWEPIEIIPTGKGFTLKWKATIPVPGNTIEETGLDIVELNDGLISRNEVFFDRLKWMEVIKTNNQ